MGARHLRSNYGTSSEDALNEASKLEWRAPALRSFVIIGSRPPSVRSMGGTYAVICPQDLDWRLELKTLRAMNVRTIAVTDPVPWQKYSELGTRSSGPRPHGRRSADPRRGSIWRHSASKSSRRSSLRERPPRSCSPCGRREHGDQAIRPRDPTGGVGWPEQR